MDLTFRSMSESAPGPAWRKVFRRGWPGWRKWFLKNGENRAPDLERGRRALRRYMPEMEPLWQRLVAEVRGDEDAARFLTFWTPPRYLVNCCQAVLIDDDGPLLIRNYDLDPALNESTLLKTFWRGRAVIGMVEGLSGLADGMNDAGLAISLTFGGRTVTGNGFGIPLILRYVLEVCRDVQDAVEALRFVPSHMAYNVTVLDREGQWATLFLSPDRPPIISKKPWTTNHQLRVEWPRHGRLSNTVKRAEHLEALLSTPRVNGQSLARAFLSAPLFGTGYARGFGTVYTAMYRPGAGQVALMWPKSPPKEWSFEAFPNWQLRVAYSSAGSRLVKQGSMDSGRLPNSRAIEADKPDLLATPVAGDVGELRGFFAALTENLADPGCADWSRLAAFWRCVHLDLCDTWQNPNISPKRKSS